MTIGIIIGIILVIGISALAVTNTSSNETNTETGIEAESTAPEGGKQFVLILNDDITSASQP